MPNDCIFCKIISKENPAKIEFEDRDILAFNDIHPKAPIHILIIPKKHIESLEELDNKDKELIGKMVLTARQIAQKKGLSEKGYRLVVNYGKHAGMIVDHLHLHLIGGKHLGSLA